MRVALSAQCDKQSCFMKPFKQVDMLWEIETLQNCWIFTCCWQSCWKASRAMDETANNIFRQSRYM